MDTRTHCNNCGSNQEEIKGAFTLTDPMLQLYKKCNCAPRVQMVRYKGTLSKEAFDKLNPILQKHIMSTE